MGALPWFYAFDHLPATVDGSGMVTGDGALDLQVIGGGSASRLVADTISGRSRTVYRTHRGACYIAKNVPAGTQFTIGGFIRLARDKDLIRWMVGGDEKLLLTHAAGALQLMRGATVLCTGPALALNIWTYIEVGLVLDATVGHCRVRINGVAEASMDLDAANTSNVAGDVTSIMYGHTWGNVDHNMNLSDLYIREELEFYGPIQLRLLNLDSDIAVDWVPDSGATNYTQAQLPVNVASYLDSDTLSDVDENGVEDLPASANSIIAVVRVSVSEAPDGGAPQIKHGLKRGATAEYGTERTVGVGGVRSQLTVFGTQPNSDPWSLVAVDEIVSLRESA